MAQPILAKTAKMDAEPMIIFVLGDVKRVFEKKSINTKIRKTGGAFVPNGEVVEFFRQFFVILSL